MHINKLVSTTWCPSKCFIQMQKHELKKVAQKAQAIAKCSIPNVLYIGFVQSE